MEKYPEFSKLVEIMEMLRSDNGCDWDKKQTHKSLIKYLREESFEVIEAIYAKDDTLLCEELGDLLLQVIFHAVVAKSRNKFDINDILKVLNKKLIDRHPHVFKDDHVQETSLEEQWENLKLEENPHKKTNKDRFHEIPENMDPVLMSERIQLLAEKDKFDWENVDQIIDKVNEEIAEFKDALKSNSKDEIKEELGDILFSVINICRFLKFDTNDLLIKSNKKFMKRYNCMIDIFKEENPNEKFKKTLIDIKESYWKKASILNKK